MSSEETGKDSDQDEVGVPDVPEPVQGLGLLKSVWIVWIVRKYWEDELDISW